MVANAPKQYKMHQNISLGSNVVYWVGSLRKILTQLRGTNFCIILARFSTSLVRQPNGPKCTQMVRNAPKHEFRVICGGLGAYSRKIPIRLRGTNFCTSSARFAPSFVRQPNGPKCTQMVRDAEKRVFMFQWCGSGAFIAKNSDVTSWHELLH